MSRFAATWAKTMSDIEDTFRKWKVADWTTKPMRELDKRNHYWAPEECAVEVQFVLRGDTVKLTCAAQPYYADNFRVLYYAVEAMRMNEDRGLTNIMRDAYMQLSAPKAERDPHEILGVRPDAPSEVVAASYKALVKQYHPDVGGDAAKFKEVQDAYERISK